MIKSDLKSGQIVNFQHMAHASRNGKLAQYANNKTDELLKNTECISRFISDIKNASR